MPSRVEVSYAYPSDWDKHGKRAGRTQIMFRKLGYLWCRIRGGHDWVSQFTRQRWYLTCYWCGRESCGIVVREKIGNVQSAKTDVHSQTTP